MKRDTKSVAYSFEHGDETLPNLKDLVSEKEDAEKDIILSYLRTNCALGCPGIVQDEINPAEVIGHGHRYYDGTYYWDDVFTNYIDRYNIPVPEEFRTHILKNYDSRIGRHAMLQQIDSVEIHNNPFVGYRFDVRIYRNGVVKYKNNIEANSEAISYIKPEDAQYIIDPIMTEIFCYDADNHGKEIIDGYHWEIVFYINNKAIDKVEGWPNEDRWRYGEVKSIIEFAERYIPYSIGFEYMNFYAYEP